MLKNRSISLLILMLSAGLVLDILVHSFSMKSVEAQQNNNPKWEYCRVWGGGGGADNFGKVKGYAYIQYFQLTGIKRDEITLEGQNNGFIGDEALAQTFAKLGEQGWEMYDIISNEGFPSYHYLKRLKR